MCAPTAETMRIWVDVIFTGADGHTEAYGLVGECKWFNEMIILFLIITMQ